MTVNGRSPAPYEVLKSRDALVEAAKLNQRILILLDDAGSDSTMDPKRNSQKAAEYAQVALSLSTYALAVDRWSP
jgi:hypothetical protein